MKQEITLFVFAEKDEININLKENKLNKLLYKNSFLSLEIYRNINLNKEFAFLICGVGKVNASFSLSNAVFNLEKNGYRITQIINIGPVGSCVKNIEFLDTFLVKNAYFFDVDLRALEGYKLGQLPNNQYLFQTSKKLNSKINEILNLNYKNILSADRFFSINDIKEINQNFDDISLVDMEAASLVMCANLLNIEISLIKIVSDNLFSTTNSYVKNKDLWKNRVSEVFIKILKEI